MAINEQINIDIKPFLDGLNKLAVAAKKVSGDVQTLLSKSGAIKLNVQADGKDLDKIEKQIDDISKNSEINVKVNASGNGNFLSGFSSQFKEAQAQAKAGGGIFGSLASQLGSFATPAGAATAAIGALTAGFAATVNIGKEFETNIQAVSAVTGLTGEDLDKLGQAAIDLSTKFGGDASNQLKSFQGILSRFGADLAKTPEQLTAVSENVNILAKAGGLDAAQAMDTLTNSMLQFGVNVSDPNEAAAESARYINVLAASAKVGAAEIPQVGEAVLVAGVAAKQANVSFEETNAAIQVLAAGGKVGAEAGTALRNVLGKIAGEDVIPKEALAKLKSLGVDMNKVSNTAIPLSERLVELGKASKDATAFAQVFGTENAAAASILANGANTIKDWTAEITGTNEASEQAAKNMATFSEAISRLQANVEAVAIGIYKKISPILALIANSIANIFGGKNGNVFDPFVKSLENLWNKSKPIFDFLVNVIGKVLVNNFLFLKNVWTNTFNILVNTFNGLIDAFSPLKDVFAEFFQSTGEGVDVFEILKDAAILLTDVFAVTLQAAINVVIGAIKLLVNIVAGLVSGIKSVASFIVNLVKSIYDWATSFSFVNKAIEATVKFISNLVNGVKDAFTAVKQFLGLQGESENAYFAQAEAAKEAANGIIQNLNAKKENNKATQAEIIAIQSAISSYKELGNQSNLTAVKKAELQKSIQLLSEKYPKLISLTKSYAANIVNVGQIEDELKKRNEAVSKSNDEINKQIDEQSKKIRFTERNVAVETVINAKVEQGQDVYNAIAKGFKNTIYKATTSDEVQNALNKAYQELNENAAKLGGKQNVDAIKKNIDAAAQSAIKALNEQVKTNVSVPDVAPPPPKPPTKEEEDLLKILQEKFAIEKEIAENQNTRNKLAIENLRIEQGIEVSKEDKNELAKKELANAENLVKKYTEIFKIVRDETSGEIKIGVGLSREEKLKVEKEFLGLLTDVNAKKFTLGLNVETKIDYKKEIEKISSNFSNVITADITPTFGIDEAKKAANDLFDALNEQERAINAKLAVSTDKGEIDALRALLAQIDKERKEGDKKYAEFVKKYDEQQFQAKLSLITKNSDREIAIKIRSLVQQRDKELENTLLTEEGKKNIRERYQKEIDALTEKTNNEFLATFGKSFAELGTKLGNAFVGANKEQEKQYEDAKKNLDEVNKKHEERIKQIDAELAAIKETNKSGGVIYNKNTEKILQLEEQKKQAILESNKEIEDANKRLEESSITTSKLIRNSFAESFAKIAELSQTQTNKAAENIGNLFASLKTDAEGNFTNLTETTDKVFAQLTTAAGASIATIGAGFGQLIAQGKANFGDFAKVAANAVLDAVQVMVNAYAAAIFGQNAAALPFGLGIPAALGLIATLNGLLAVAKASIGGIGAEDGVININKGYNKKKGITDTIPLWVAPNESIINAKSSIKYSNLLKAINGDGGSIVDGVLKSLNTKEIAALKNQLGSNTIQLNTERNIVQLPINTRQSNDEKQYAKLEKLLSNLNVKIDRNEKTEISGKFDISGNNLTTVVNKIQKRKTRGF